VRKILGSQFVDIEKDKELKNSGFHTFDMTTVSFELNSQETYVYTQFSEVKECDFDQYFSFNSYFSPFCTKRMFQYPSQSRKPGLYPRPNAFPKGIGATKQKHAHMVYFNLILIFVGEMSH
jgi:hypothetical protein